MITPMAAAIVVIVSLLCFLSFVLRELIREKINRMRTSRFCEHCGHDKAIPLFLMEDVIIEKFLRLYPSKKKYESYHLACVLKMFELAGEPNGR